jgi:outer membrane protein insertion porin family
MPAGGAYPQTSDNAPTTPAASAATNAPPAAAPAEPAPADQATIPSDAASGKKNKKLVGAPDTEAPTGNQNGPIVRAIDIQYIGPANVAKSVILSNMRTTVGNAYSAASVEEDVRNLYATGFFTNLAIKDEPMGDGVKVNVVVQPKPLVKEIVITGAGKIKQSRIKKEIKSKIGDSLSEQQVSSDADKL